METGKNIGEVIQALQKGKHARRAGWNGKQMHLYLEEGCNLGQGGMRRKQEPYLVLFTTAQTHQPGWNASTADLLADDWEILEPYETEGSNQSQGNSGH